MIIVLKLRFFIPKEYQNDKGYHDRIKNEVSLSNEIYNNIDIRFQYEFKVININEVLYNDDFYFFNRHLPRNLWYPIVKEYQLSSMAKNLFLNNKIRHMQEDNIVKVFCFKRYFDSEQEECDIRAAAIPSIVTKIKILKNSICLAEKRSEYSLAHELSHILLDEVHRSNYRVPKDNIFNTPASKHTTQILEDNFHDYIDRVGYQNTHPACRLNQAKLMRTNALRLKCGLL